MIIDSHCHLDYPDLHDQLENVLERAKNNNVDKLLTICTTLNSFEKIKSIINKYKNIYGTFGIHPHEVKNFLNVNLFCFLHFVFLDMLVYFFFSG